MQVEKAFREGTARQNAHSVFVSLALKLLEERVHVACKEIITLEKQVSFICDSRCKEFFFVYLPLGVSCLAHLLAVQSCYLCICNLNLCVCHLSLCV